MRICLLWSPKNVDLALRHVLSHVTPLYESIFRGSILSTGNLETYMIFIITCIYTHVYMAIEEEIFIESV